jgi:hypothetical protein
MRITSGTSVSIIAHLGVDVILSHCSAAPYIPPIDPSNASDTQNFDEAFLDMEPVISDEPDPTDSERERTDESDSESARIASDGKSPERPAEPEDESVDVFDGYSFKGRHSVIIEEEEEKKEGEDSQIRDAEVLESSVSMDPITVNQDLATPHPAGLPPLAKSEVSTEVESSAYLVALSTPEPKDTGLSEPPKTPVVVPTSNEPNSTTPVVSPSLNLSDRPPLSVENPGELAEPAVSPVIPPAVENAAASIQKREKPRIVAFDRAVEEDSETEDWDLIERPNGEEAAAFHDKTGMGRKLGNSLPWRRRPSTSKVPAVLGSPIGDGDQGKKGKKKWTRKRFSLFTLDTRNVQSPLATFLPGTQYSSGNPSATPIGSAMVEPLVPFEYPF